MADRFITVDIETDAATLADNAVTQLQGVWPGWVPNDGDMEVVQIETVAPMAADVAQVAAIVFPAIFRAYGTKLIGLPYQAGSVATGDVTFTLTDLDGHTITAGSAIDIDGVEFTTDSDAIVAAGDDTAAAVPVTASVLGIVGNDLAGDVVSPISALSFVASISLDAPTAGGVDPEVDSGYQDRLSQQLELQAKTIITTRDFEIEALNYPGVGRALAIGDTARNVTIALATPAGGATSGAIKTALEAIYEEFRQVNTTYTVIDPTFTTVDVTYSVKQYQGFNATDLKDRIDAQLADVLSPVNWGRPKSSGDAGPPTGWQNTTVVRRNKLIDLIGDVDGVDYVNGLVIAGSAGTVDGVNQKDTADFTGTVTGGTYTWTVDGQTTSALNHNATNAEVQAALEALSTVEPGDALLAGGPGPTDYTVTWVGRYAYRARTTSISSSVTGGGSLAIAHTTAVTAGSGDLTLTGTAPLTTAGAMAGTIF